MIHSAAPEHTMRFFEELFDWTIRRTDLGAHVGNTRFPMAPATDPCPKRGF